jgi:hypothetical protein
VEVSESDNENTNLVVLHFVEAVLYHPALPVLLLLQGAILVKRRGTAAWAKGAVVSREIYRSESQRLELL